MFCVMKASYCQWYINVGFMQGITEDASLGYGYGESPNAIIFQTMTLFLVKPKTHIMEVF